MMDVIETGKDLDHTKPHNVFFEVLDKDLQVIERIFICQYENYLKACRAAWELGLELEEGRDDIEYVVYQAT